MDPLRPLCTRILSLRRAHACTVTTMAASAVFRGLLFVGLLTVVCRGQMSQEVTAEDSDVEKAEPAADRDLVSTRTHRTVHDGGRASQNNAIATKPCEQSSSLTNYLQRSFRDSMHCSSLRENPQDTLKYCCD